jgi:hypothetical protein
MFPLFQSSPKFPKVKTVNLKVIQQYIAKFEESLRNLEEYQKELKS